MENEQPNYYAIIPASVRYDKIPANAKLLYGEITALCNANGYCWASNQYFASLYGVTTQAISKWVNLLAKAGHIKLKYEYNGKEIKQRHIYISEKEVSINIVGVSTNDEKGINKRLKGYQQMIKDNNTTTNNTYNITFNKEKIYKKEIITSDEVNSIIEEFNKTFNSSYRVTPDRSKKIKLRLKTYTLDEIKKAIHNLYQSKFHRGENDTGWKATIDFIIRNDEKIDEFLNSEIKDRPHFISYTK